MTDSDFALIVEMSKRADWQGAWARKRINEMLEPTIFERIGTPDGPTGVVRWKMTCHE